MIDTHCHLDLILEKGINFNEVEQGLIDNHIKAVIQIASDPPAMEFSAPFCHEKSGKIQYFYTVGIHPNEAHELDIDSGIKFSKASVADPRFVGIGEVGLDYYYGLDHRILQLQTFEMYLNLARELNKPVVVHTRNAHDDTVALLRLYSRDVPVLIHCFTGTKDQMMDYLDLGAMISFSGIVTFKNAQDIRDAALHCPLERMVVETDAPFLAPVPERGKVNRPSWVKYVAEFLSELRAADIRPILYENSKKLFKLPL